MHAKVAPFNPKTAMRGATELMDTIREIKLPINSALKFLRAMSRSLENHIPPVIIANATSGCMR